MIYSVSTGNQFTMYEAPGEFPPTGQFRKPRGQPIQGLFPPSQYLPLVPGGSVVLGTGPSAQGVLAVMPTGLIEGLPEPVKRWGVGALLVGVGWWLRSLWRK